MGLGTPKSNAGDIAAAQERNRQNLINSGLAQINAIYGGGTYGINPVDFSKGGSFYDPSGMSIKTATTASDPLFKSWLQSRPQISKELARMTKPTGPGAIGGATERLTEGFAPGVAKLTDIATGFNPWSSIFGGKPKTLTLDQVRNLYAKYLGKSGELFSGTATSPGFGPDFYNKRAMDYINFALPQVEEQASQQGRQLTYRLANQGLTGSSSGQQLGASLLEEIGRQRAGVASSAVGQAQELQRQVEQSRANAIAQLEASANPATAAQGALRTAASFSAPSQFQPISNLFSNWANTYLATQVPQTNPSLLPYLYSLPSSRLSSSSSIIPGNTIN